MKLSISLDPFYLLFGICPKPSYRNVRPDGEGWYRFDDGVFWIKWKSNPKYANFDGRARYLTDGDLARFTEESLSTLATGRQSQ